eukprot:364515-Chlamydomonas_euryale.AAC.14
MIQWLSGRRTTSSAAKVTITAKSVVNQACIWNKSALATSRAQEGLHKISHSCRGERRTVLHAQPARAYLIPREQCFEQQLAKPACPRHIPPPNARIRGQEINLVQPVNCGQGIN